MGKTLMDIPVFAESIRKSQQVLQSKGVDLINIITNDDPRIMDVVINPFVGVVAIEVIITLSPPKFCKVSSVPNYKQNN